MIIPMTTGVQVTFLLSGSGDQLYLVSIPESRKHSQAIVVAIDPVTGHLQMLTCVIMDIMELTHVSNT
jgi:hypothetical protein